MQPWITRPVEGLARAKGPKVMVKRAVARAEYASSVGRLEPSTQMAGSVEKEGKVTEVVQEPRRAEARETAKERAKGRDFASCAGNLVQSTRTRSSAPSRKPSRRSSRSRSQRPQRPRLKPKEPLRRASSRTAERRKE